MAITNINISDNTNASVDYKNNNNTTNLLLSDTSTIYNKFVVNESEDIIFIIHPTLRISDYIKRIPEELLEVNDSSRINVDFRNTQKENIVISDSTISHLHTIQTVNDSINFRSEVRGNVIYGPDTSASNTTITDSVFAFISKHSSRNFKNAMFNLLGTTEEIIYTCDVKNTTIINISLCNRTLNNINIDVLLYKSGIPIYIMKGILVKPHQSYVINNNSETNVQLEGSDEIRMITDTDNSSDIYMALMEQS